MVENSSYRRKLIRQCLDVLGLHSVLLAVVWLLHQQYCNAWWLIVTNFLPVVIVQFQLDRLMAATELCFAFPIPMTVGTEGQGGRGVIAPPDFGRKGIKTFFFVSSQITIGPHLFLGLPTALESLSLPFSVDEY